MLDFLVAPAGTWFASGKYPIWLSLDGTLHAFLSRYFARASLRAGDINFLSLYGSTDVTGYQLVRLRQELQEAVLDLAARPEKIRVFAGWRGREPTESTEDWRDLDREEAKSAALELIRLIGEAREQHLCLVAIGE